MSRSVTKSIASATIHVFNPSKDFELGENGMPIANVSFAVDGNPSPNKARILAEKFCKSKNVMVISIDVDESKLVVAPDVFFANSDICKEGETYGREYVTQTFKITEVSGFYIDKEGMHPFTDTYNGTTTNSKLLNFVRELFGVQTTITKKTIIEERRFMTRDKYVSLAK